MWLEFSKPEGNRTRLRRRAGRPKLESSCSILRSLDLILRARRELLETFTQGSTRSDLHFKQQNKSLAHPLESSTYHLSFANGAALQ
jgi:hypothetical protein